MLCIGSYTACFIWWTNLSFDGNRSCSLHRQHPDKRIPSSCEFYLCPAIFWCRSKHQISTMVEIWGHSSQAIRIISKWTRQHQAKTFQLTENKKPFPSSGSGILIVFCKMWGYYGAEIKIPTDSFHNLLELLGLWWRPQGDLNPCRRRERPMSWTGLDDGDADGGGPCWTRTNDSLLKRQILYRLS